MENKTNMENKTITCKSYRNYFYKLFTGFASILILGGISGIYVVTEICLDMIHCPKYLIGIIEIGMVVVVFFLILSLLNISPRIMKWLNALEKLFCTELTVEFDSQGIEFFLRLKKVRLEYDSIYEVITWPVLFGRGEINPLAYKMIIKTKHKKYSLYSEQLNQNEYHYFKETEAYEIYKELRRRGVKCG